MLVLSMNSKRQRRPNVRLGEVGDVPAAFACGISQKTEKMLGHNRWEHDFVNLKDSEYYHSSGFSPQMSSEFTVEDPCVCTMISVDMQQNRENKNPNSMKSVPEFASSDDIDVRKSKLNFGTINRMSMVMKRRRRSARGKRSVFGGPWHSKIGPESSSEDGIECGRKEAVGFASIPCSSSYHIKGRNDSFDHETLVTSKEACKNDIDEPISDHETWKGGACREGNNVFSQTLGRDDEIEIRCSDVYCVRKWLEELGFGKYAGVFEMHEVDEEALPLLTFEDLKEMGVLTVGPRRKLYIAIQQLREGRERVST